MSFKLLRFFFLSLFFSSYGISMTTVDYNDIRRVGFGSSQLQSVTCITHQYGDVLTDDEKLSFINSRNLTHVYQIDFSNQDLSYIEGTNQKTPDDFVQSISNNPTFSRLFNINLGNTEITVASLTSILNSRYIGSVKHLQTISSRYGVPSSEIYVDIRGCELIPRPQWQQYHLDSHQNNFQIQYRHPVLDYPTGNDVQNGIKMLNLSSDYN